MMKNKIIFFISLIAVCALVVLYNVPFHIHREELLYEYKIEDETYTEKRNIVLDGKYNVNLFSQDSFSGTINISGYEMNNPLVLPDEFVSEHLNQKRANATIYKDLSGTEPEIFGTLLAKPFLSEITIIVGDSCNGIKGTFITKEDRRKNAINKFLEQFTGK